MSIYQMSCFKLPKKNCKNIKKIQRDFWWGKNIENPKGTYLKAWDSFCKSIENGGLGLQNIEQSNKAMLAKMGWRLQQDPDSLWGSILKALYYPNTDIMHLNLTQKRTDRWIWKGIKSGIGI